MDDWIWQHADALIRALFMIAAGTLLVLFLLKRAANVNAWPRTERRAVPRETSVGILDDDEGRN